MWPILDRKAQCGLFNREADPASGGLIEFGYYGDWLALQPTPSRRWWPQLKSVLSNSWSIWLRIFVVTKAMWQYNATLTQLKQAYHTKYWNASAQSCRSGSQAANLMPLILDIPPTKTARTLWLKPLWPRLKLPATPQNLDSSEQAITGTRCSWSW